MSTVKQSGQTLLPASEFNIFPILLRSSGIDFSLYKSPTLKRAIQKRMQAMSIRQPADYLELLKKDPKEAQKLSASMLIRVTGFFRDPDAFKVLKQKVFPQLVKHKGQGPVRIWVPGCCSGEEVYSWAIALTEFSGSTLSFQIFGTDLNEDCLKKARTGIYEKKELKGLSGALIGRYFNRINGGQYEVHKNIRSSCTFAKQNLVQDPPFSKLDVISCRNLLIYLKSDIQDKLIRTFHYSLNPYGILMLGKSENIGVFHPTLFTIANKNHSIYCKKETALKQKVSFHVSQPLKQGPIEARSLTVPYEFDVGREMDRVLIERTGHAAVLINESNEVIQTKGNVSSYFRLPSGRMTFNVIKMANDELTIELKMMLQKAQKSREVVGRRIETDKGAIEVEVVPLHRSLLNEKHFLILLSPSKPESGGNGFRKTSKHSPDKERTIVQLRQELAATKAWMQSMIEDHDHSIQELKSANEEILSSNEELQSLNEELQTAKEELESTNEEITTVNEQLNHQIEALRQSEERFRILVESVRDYAIFMLDVQGRVVTWNVGAERIKGYRADEIIGRHFSKFYPKEDQEKPQMELRIASRKGVYKEEGWRVRKDGSTFWARVVLTALRGSGGKLRGFAKVTYDMTEQKKAEDKLRETEERFRLMVEQVQDYAIFMLDAEGKIMTWNMGAQRLKQYTAEEIMGKHISTFYPPETKKAKLPQRLLAIAIQEGRAYDEGWRVRKDGTRFWANCIITALKDKDGELRGFSKVTRDMTERKKKEDELSRAYHEMEDRVRERTKELQEYSQQLSRSNADLQQFAYIASHDLQEPLRVVSVYADLLKRHLKESGSEDVKTYLDFLHEGAVRSQRLIKELLEYSRIGAQAEKFVHVSMEIVITHVLSLMDVSIRESGARITYDPLPTVQVDRFQMEQLFQNIFSNAIKYRSQNAPQIHVSARRQENEWVFMVKDNGIGIEPQYHQSIFNVFKRLHTTKDYPGTGIGLALAKKIVERHGGKIWVESQFGKGATFCIALPAERAYHKAMNAD